MTTDEAILHYCKYQERCHQEVRNKLYELGCNTAQVNEKLAELITSGHLNEERFARAFARGRFRMKGWGRAKIKYELKVRGISDYCINKAFTEIDEGEYDAMFQKLAAAKARSCRGEKNLFAKKGKVYRHLVQKGYERDIVADFVAKME